MIPNLRAELESLVPEVVQSPWKGQEHVRGYAVFGLPLSSGHTLALRVFPINDFAPYITIWHQTPEGVWTIYYDAIRPDIACPRYYGPAVERSVPVTIKLTWRSPCVLTVQMKKPNLKWTLWMEEPFALRIINSISRRMPFWTWKYGPLLRIREWIAGRLGIGDIKLADYMPSGHFGILMPERMYFISRTIIEFEGTDLGDPALLKTNPKIGKASLPARGIFAVGQAHWEILDYREYNETRAALAAQLKAKIQPVADNHNH